MLKQYKIGAYIFQYEEGTQPDGAVEYKPETKATPAEATAPAEKAKPAPKNKAKAVANK